MKKFIVLLLLLLSLHIYSQDIAKIRTDITTLLEEVGRNVIAVSQQNALANTGIGMAEFGDSSFFIAFSAGGVITPGIFEFVNDYSFELLNVSSLLQTTLPTEVYDYLTNPNNEISYINYGLSAGIKAFDTELLIQFSIWPQLLTDAIAGAFNFSGLELDSLNLGLRLRKSLIKERGGLPALSMGIGYLFSKFHLGYSIPEFTQATINLILRGDLFMDTYVHTFGVDLNVSKRLWFFIPFLTVSTYYQLTSYNAGITNYHAEITSPFALDNKQPNVSLAVNNLSVLLTSGFDILLGGFALTPSATFNTANTTFSFNLGMRVQL